MNSTGHEAAAAPQTTSSGPAPLQLSRPSTNTLLLLAIVALVSAWPFWGALQWLWGFWIESAEYSHGLLMPALCGFLIWTRRDRLAELPFTGSWLGVLLVVLAGVVYWFGNLATLHVVDNFAYLTLLIGVALSLLGAKAFRVVAIPLALLALAIPLPNLLLNNVSLKLQLWSTEIGAAIIQMLGISVYVQGNVIDLGVYKLEVAQACSGLRYLFPLLTLGILLAYLYHGAMWKRVLIALSSLPLTVLMNSLRIGLIGLMVDRWGPSLAEGFVHDFQGWAMFMLTGALMVGALALLHPLGGNNTSWRDAFGIPAPVVRPPGTKIRATPAPAPFLAAIAVVCTIAAIGEWAPAPAEAFASRTTFFEFPNRIGDWVGHRQGMDAQYLDALQLDDYLLADYAKPGETGVNLYIAYYKAQHSSRSAHSPRSCLPAGGWVMTQFAAHDVPGLSVGAQPLRVNRAIMEQGHVRQLVYYWFQQRGRVITSEYADKWYLLWDGLTRHRTDGALVRLITPLPAEGGVEEADHRLEAFAAPMVRTLPAFVPD